MQLAHLRDDQALVNRGAYFAAVNDVPTNHFRLCAGESQFGLLTTRTNCLAVVGSASPQSATPLLRESCLPSRAREGVGWPRRGLTAP